MFRFKGGKNFQEGNKHKLFKDGDEFFPQLARRIKRARKEVFIETFILADDRVGRVIRKALIRAARRGAFVSVTADSYGSFYLPNEYIQSLTDAGVIFQIYDPQPSWFNSRPKVFRRLHRKLAVIDNEVAFVGGINLCVEHMTANQPGGKRDFAVELQGPVVSKIRQLCKSYVREAKDNELDRAEPPKFDTAAGGCPVSFISRDNKRNRSEIEKAYLAAIHSANKRVLLANAYFFPGYRVMHALRRAARRGVEVGLVLQGNPDIPFALRAARCLYDTLTRSGIKVYEYSERPLHAKIAVIDDEWCTIGSSNLDPWSLSMNLEANVFIRDHALNKELENHIQDLMANSTVIQYSWVKQRDFWYHLRDTMTYHLLRRLPDLISWIPNHRPKIREVRSFFETEQGQSLNADLRRQFPESRNARRVVFKQDYHDASEF